MESFKTLSISSLGIFFTYFANINLILSVIIALLTIYYLVLKINTIKDVRNRNKNH